MHWTSTTSMSPKNDNKISREQIKTMMVQDMPG